MSMKVLRSGLLTSVQDLGRFGMQKHGVIVSGAMDAFALRVANLLVGNEEGDAVLEITMQGPILQFMEDSLIAICGGDLSPAINGHAISQWRPIFVKKGSQLTFGAVQSGCRSYLAAAGGINVPKVMNSRSTYLRAGIGGFCGRALKNGDELKLKRPSNLALRRMHRLSEKAGSSSFSISDWSVSKEILPDYFPSSTIRVIPGGQFDWFTPQTREQFFKEDFFVTPQSDRMGYRLSGPQLQLTEARELVSEAVTAGTIQVPSDGNPIVLMADRQTTGGYPKIAQVATIDIPILAQMKPGEKIRFQKIQLEEAQELLRSREKELRLLKQGLSLKE